MSDLQDTIGSAVEPTPTPTPTTQQNVIDRAAYEELQRQHNGLKGHAQNLKKQYEEKVLTLDQTSQQLEALRLEAEQAKSSATDYSKKMEALTGLHTQTLAELELARTIMGDYPELARLYSKGLINVSGKTPEEVKSYLDGLKSEISGTVDQLAQNQLSGATPQPPKPTTQSKTEDVASLYKQLMKARPGTPEYADLYKRYTAAL